MFLSTAFIAFHKNWNIIYLFSFNSKYVVIFLFLSYSLFLLGWWLIQLYGFQVYSSIRHHLYIELCVHHPRSSLQSPFITPYNIFYQLLPCFLSGNHHIVACVCVFVCLFVCGNSSSFLPRPITYIPCIYESLSILLVYFFIRFQIIVKSI